jgi:hypothetical protein
MTTYCDEFGFELEGMEAWCLYCEVGGRSAKWPKWKRERHYEANHKAAAVAAKRQKAREDRRQRLERIRQPMEPEEAEWWLRRDGGEPAPEEVAALIAYDAAMNGHAEVEPLPASTRQRERRRRSKRWLATHAPRPCRECEGAFEPTDLRQVYCSPPCQKRYARRVAKMAARNGNGLPPKGGPVATHNPRSSAGSPVTNEALPTCAQCATQFEPVRTDQRYCSNACRQRAYRERTSSTAAGATWWALRRGGRWLSVGWTRESWPS